MNNFPDCFRLNVGIYVEEFIKWLTRNCGSFFNAQRDATLAVLNAVESTLLWIPWWVIVILVFVAGWRLKKLTSGIIYALLLIIAGCFGFWDLMMYTFAIVLVSVVISLLIGIPVGILMASYKRFGAILKPLLDAMQTMPSFVYLIPAVMFFSMGKVPAVFATTIYAIPPVTRLTNLAIRQVDAEMVEAARSFGSTSWQLLVKVQLPQALPTIMTGINQTTMMAMSMVVVCSMIGAKGLGMEVLVAINRLEIGRGFESGLVVVFMAIIIDRISQSLSNKFRIPG